MIVLSLRCSLVGCEKVAMTAMRMAASDNCAAAVPLAKLTFARLGYWRPAGM
jgi:hypothetical protein